MFDFSRIQNYYIQTGYTDMRMQIDGLAAKVQLEHGRQMEETSIYLFCGRKSDRIKAIYCWMRDGSSGRGMKAS